MKDSRMQYLVANLLEISIRGMQQNMHSRLFQRMLATTLGLFSQSGLAIEPSIRESYRTLTSKSCVVLRNGQVLFKTACLNRAPSMIRRLRHHRMLTLASFCSAYMSSKYVLKSNLEYLLQGILLSASA